MQHLIDFNAKQIRGYLIERIKAPLTQREWRELQNFRAKEWRDETLSARNRLFRLLTSEALVRFMGLPYRTLDLKAIMDDGKILLVNLDPSDAFSAEEARVFGALMINEFFECARRRKEDALGRDPKAYYLYMDEFQKIVSLDIADMLDEVRKRGLFTILAHQRFGHLDEKHDRCHNYQLRHQSCLRRTSRKLCAADGTAAIHPGSRRQALGAILEAGLNK